MRKKYYSEKEIQDALIKARDEFNNKICPVLRDRGMCKNCHSYKPGYFTFSENAEKIREYMLNEPWCTCALVTGIIEVDGI
jgi:hypothetical protein